MRIEPIAKYANLSLIVAFPIAWFAPLLHTGLLPQWQMPNWLGGSTLFEPDTLTVVSGIQKLWETDVFLAVAVIFFALVAPILKCIGLALVHFGVGSQKFKPYFALMSKLAMADVFLIALYIVIAKGIGIGEIKVAWGLYLFTACVISSMLISLIKKREETC